MHCNPMSHAHANRGDFSFLNPNTGQSFTTLRFNFEPAQKFDQATYHGPGQLMGYPIIDLRNYGQDLHKYLRWIEGLLIEFLDEFEIKAQRREGLTGVWVQERKIASIGVGVRHWITMHGFALNVCGDLSPFNHIVPCGINDVTMTSMEKETGARFFVGEIAASVEKLALNRIGDLRTLAEPEPISI